MLACPQCSTEAKESDARFCYRCGTPLPTPKQESPDGTYWIVFTYFNQSWYNPFGGGNHTPDEALAQLNQGNIYRGDEPTYPNMPERRLRLGSVHQPDGTPANVLIVLEWYELTRRDADGGYWAQGAEAADRPEGNRIEISSLERA
ncbi:MAG TPA: zinc ribbon domain-containing protein [Candidatus Saccharimonadales bacterium]|nr:zinc ribbon domain-containing protein [Candidatus Saccharimonadales bacterium]